MEEIINVFVENHFTEEFTEQVHISFGLFTALDYDLPFQAFADMAMNESSVDTSTMKDTFVLKLHEHLNFVLTQYKIKLVDWAKIEEKNEIIRALVAILHVEDYTGIIRSLETMEPDEVQLSEALSEFTTFDITKIMELLEEVSPVTIQTLKNFIYEKEKAEELQNYTEPKIIRHMRFFNEVFGKDNLAYHMVSGQMLTGQTFETYIPFVIQVYNPAADIKKTALDILSVLFISSDGFNSPLLTYRKNSHKLIDELNVITKVEVEILNHIAKLAEHKKAADEKARVSQTVVTI